MPDITQDGEESMERTGKDAAIVGKKGQGNWNLKMGMWLMIFLLTFGCSGPEYSRRSESENLIQAPIDVVWENTLQILRSEQITIKTVTKLDYFIDGWDWWGDEIRIRMTSEKPGQVFLFIDVSSMTLIKWVVWGLEERTMQNLYEKIRRASEA